MKSKAYTFRRAVLTSLSLICLLLTCTTLQAQKTDVQNKVEVSKEVLKTYLGNYQMGPDTLKIIMEGDSIKADGPGYPPLQLIAKKENRFLLKRFGVDIEFVKGDDGQIVKLLMIRPDGQQLEAKRIEQ